MQIDLFFVFVMARVSLSECWRVCRKSGSGYDSIVCRYRGGKYLVGDIVACRWIALEFECHLDLIFGIRLDSVTVS